jgi:2-polyprenyl-3-methyl-5-hydroxy-6-metoxy-1,4-benzoquinol methylase
LSTDYAIDASVESRARVSLGVSAEAIYRMVAAIVRERHECRGTLLDVGCGTGSLLPFVRDSVDSYRGADAVHYDAFPAGHEFVQVDLDAPRWPIDDESADMTVAVETIEHLENPRAFFRELMRVTRAGGLIVVTTPNQLSVLSKLTLVLKNQFNAFQEASYPAHRTALLEVDLRRMAHEVGLADAQVRYTDSGRIPGTPWHWPGVLRGRMFSDNVAISARRTNRASGEI